MKNKKLNKTKRLTYIACFAAMALVIFVVENQIPPLVAIPGAKIGLANAITLVALYIMPPIDAFLVMLIRVVLGNIFTGQAISFVYSICGGTACFLTMYLLSKVKKLFGENQIWAVSVIGAIAHSTAQILVASFMLNTSLLYYFFALTLLSVIAGAFTGIVAQNAIKAINNHQMQ